MITAEQALSLTNRAIESGEPTERAIQSALEAVTRAASEGKRSVTVPFCEDPSFAKILEAAGFEVTMPEFMPIFVIRW